MTEKEAMKLALEALENSIDLVSNEAREAEKLYGKYQTRLARIQGLVALEVAHEKAITALREALAQDVPEVGFGNMALDKMAENARELGLDYEPAQHRAWFTVDELNAWADKKLKENPQWAEQPAQQEAQAEETVKERTPQERRDAGEWHCPECFTFGHQHRQGCTAAHGIKENT